MLARDRLRRTFCYVFVQFVSVLCITGMTFLSSVAEKPMRIFFLRRVNRAECMPVLGPVRAATSPVFGAWLVAMCLFVLLGCGGEHAVQGRAEGSIRDGKRHGNWEGRHFNGMRAWKGQYRDGSREGQWRWWREDGSLMETSQWQDSTRHGTCRFTHDNGELAENGSYERGLREGLWKGFHPGGEAAWEGTYRQGLKMGSWRSWYPDGRAETFGEWESDHGDEVGFHPNGQIRYQGRWQDGKRDGLWQWFDPTGRLEREAIYRKGQLLQEG